MKNKTSQIAFCGLIVALSTVFMILTFLPNFTYALPALAGALLVIVVIEVNIRYAFISYGIVAFLSVILVPDKFSVALYICFFGYYPVIKAIFERAKSNYISLIYKFVSFNLVVISMYLVATNFMYLQDNKLLDYVNGPIGIGALLSANIIFLIYDLAIDNVVSFYMKRLHNRINKSFK